MKINLLYIAAIIVCGSHSYGGQKIGSVNSVFSSNIFAHSRWVVNNNTQDWYIFLSEDRKNAVSHMEFSVEEVYVQVICTTSAITRIEHMPSSSGLMLNGKKYEFNNGRIFFQKDYEIRQVKEDKDTFLKYWTARKDSADSKKMIFDIINSEKEKSNILRSYLNNTFNVQSNCLPNDTNTTDRLRRMMRNKIEEFRSEHQVQ